MSYDEDRYEHSEHIVLRQKDRFLLISQFSLKTWWINESWPVQSKSVTNKCGIFYSNFRTAQLAYFPFRRMLSAAWSRILRFS